MSASFGEDSRLHSENPIADVSLSFISLQSVF